MRRSKKKYSPSVSFIPANSGPQSLKREKAVPEQKNWSEDTIRYGDDDALPLRIAQAVEDSPAASSCTATVAQFIKGAGFSDPALMDIIVDDQGTTLWGLHESLSECLALFEGFAVNHKYNPTGKKITQAYMIGFEGCRMTMPVEGSPMITSIKHNPYFGTNEWRRHYTECYPVHNLKTVKEEIDAAEELREKDPKQYRGYPGQVYYYGKTSPIHRFYPVPGYWSAKKWIYIDGKIQEAHSENMDNGFFQSVMLKIIGDPNAWSTNPKYIDPKTRQSSKTVGEEFAENMATNFSGSKKMGGVMALWGLNNASLPEIDAFPSTANADLFLALQDLTTKNITIARRVPPILSNISEGVSLGSGGSEIQKAVELMQSRVTAFQNVLMNYYNKILLPGMGIITPEGESAKVVIQHFNPVTAPVEMDDKFWDTLTKKEQRDFMKKNFPGVALQDLPEADAPAQKTLIEVIGVGGSQALMDVLAQYGAGTLTDTQASNILQILFGINSFDANRMIQKGPPAGTVPGAPLPEVTVDEPDPTTQEKPVSDAIKRLTAKDLQFIAGIQRRYNKGEYTYEQAKIMIQGRTGLSDVDTDVFLVTIEEDAADTTTLP
jgi:hypothetical protein